jgi:hypothetical protein
MKHIRMPRDSAAKWLEALRSGMYNQTDSVLADGDGFCCLGVLEHCLTGEVERDGDGSIAGMPTSGWLEEHGIEFRGKNGIPETGPYLASVDQYAAEINDLKHDRGDSIEHVYDFNAIAELIEEEIEFTD